MKKSILYVGNFVPPFSTENDIKKSFEELGWKVKPVQENIMTEETADEIVRTAREYDFILYTRTWARTHKLWLMVLKGTKAIGVPTVSLHLDLYIGLERGKDLLADSFFLSDYTFSADGGHQEQFKKLGINHFFLPPAVLKDSVYLGEKQKKFDYDVIFVGSYNYHHEWNYRPFLINWLKETYGNRFKLFGSDGETIRGKALNDLYASAKIIMGDSTYSPNYWSDRMPETVGRAGFLIHPYTEGLEKQFKLYKHLIPYYAGEMETLKEIIDYYLAHPKERDEIRFAGQKYVLEKHTYINRIKEMLGVLEKEKAII